MKFPFIVISLLCSSLATTVALAKTANSMDLKTLQHKLHSESVGWEADDTWVKQHAPAEIKRLLGLKGNHSTVAEFEAPTHGVMSAIVPASIDWRNMNGINYVSPVLNQGNCGSCVAFAGVATLETQMNVAFLGANMRFSPQELFSCGGGSCEGGWDLGPASQFLQNKGVPDEACDPYTSGATGDDVACSARCSNVTARSVRIASYSQPTSSFKDLDAVRAALAKGPLFASMDVYTDFLFYKSGVYKHVSGDVEGGHAISIVGYDDKMQALIIRNSWGEDWGMNGFAYVSYDDVSGIGDETFAFVAPKLDGFVAVRNPVAQSVVSGQITVQADSNYANLQNVSLTTVDGQKVNFTDTMVCSKSTCDLGFDSTKMADGRYEVYATANYGTNKTADSQHVIFYVANTVPKMSLSFDGVDLNSAVSDRVVFNVHSNAGVVPLSSVTLMVKSGGKIIYTKGTKVVLPEMTLGWRTNAIPNGTYEIYLVGTLKINDQEHTVESAHYNVTTSN